MVLLVLKVQVNIKSENGADLPRGHLLESLNVWKMLLDFPSKPGFLNVLSNLGKVNAPLVPVV